MIRKSATLLVLALVLASGCSGSKGPREWLGIGQGSAKQEGVFYAGVDGLTVRDAPKSSAEVVGRLSLHQKVVRSKITDGYALVEVPGGNLAGWVVNSKLLWKLPSTQPGETAAPVAAEETPEEMPEETPGAAEEAAAPAEGAPAPAPEAPKEPAPKPRSGASVFDPY